MKKVSFVWYIHKSEHCNVVEVNFHCWIQVTFFVFTVPEVTTACAMSASNSSPRTEPPNTTFPDQKPDSETATPTESIRPAFAKCVRLSMLRNTAESFPTWSTTDSATWSGSCATSDSSWKEIRLSSARRLVNGTELCHSATVSFLFSFRNWNMLQSHPTQKIYIPHILHFKFTLKLFFFAVTWNYDYYLYFQLPLVILWLTTRPKVWPFVAKMPKASRSRSAATSHSPATRWESPFDEPWRPDSGSASTILCQEDPTTGCPEPHPLAQESIAEYHLQFPEQVNMSK